MASLKELRNRIDSVKATQKITGAMQMVAAAKLRRAQEAVSAAKPYCDRLEAVLTNISSDLSAADKPALMQGNGRDKVHLVIVCAADRGLCGGFNGQIIRMARVFLRARIAERKDVKIIAVGRKSAELLAREFGAFFIDKIDLNNQNISDFEQARSILEDVVLRYDRQEFDVCTLFYSEFKSVMEQDPQQKQLIPYETRRNDSAFAADKRDKAGVKSAAEAARKRNMRHNVKKEEKNGGNMPVSERSASGGQAAFYEYEPNISQIAGDLVLRCLRARIFRALLENKAGEMGAKMTAMDNATRNAGAMINTLSVTFNRQRQARITTELIEIIAGAEAL